MGEPGYRVCVLRGIDDRGESGIRVQAEIDFGHDPVALAAWADEGACERLKPAATTRRRSLDPARIVDRLRT